MQFCTPVIQQEYFPRILHWASRWMWSNERLLGNGNSGLYCHSSGICIWDDKHHTHTPHFRNTLCALWPYCQLAVLPFCMFALKKNKYINFIVYAFNIYRFLFNVLNNVSHFFSLLKVSQILQFIVYFVCMFLFSFDNFFISTINTT